MAGNVGGVNVARYVQAPIEQQVFTSPYTKVANQKQYWDVTGGNNYLNDFKSYFDKVFNGMGNAPFNTQAGLGMYGGQFGYNSALLNQLAKNFSSNLANPNSSYAYGTTMDRIAAQEAAAQQALNDQFAGYGRGAGPRAAAMLQLQGELAKQKADTARSTALEAQQTAAQNALNLEGLRGGYALQGQELGLNAYNSAQERALANAALNSQYYTNLYNNQPGLLNSLANMMQWQGNQTNQNQAATRQNLLGIAQQDIGQQEAAYNAQQQNQQNQTQYGYKNYLAGNNGMSPLWGAGGPVGGWTPPGNLPEAPRLSNPAYNPYGTLR